MWTCGFWKWGAFQYRCHKEYRVGETCGLKLICDVDYKDQRCEICEKIAVKGRRAAKMQADVARWLKEGDRSATIETTTMELSKVGQEFLALTKVHGQRIGLRQLPPIRDLPCPRWAIDRTKYLMCDLSR